VNVPSLAVSVLIMASTVFYGVSSATAHDPASEGAELVAEPTSGPAGTLVRIRGTGFDDTPVVALVFACDGSGSPGSAGVATVFQVTDGASARASFDMSFVSREHYCQHRVAEADLLLLVPAHSRPGPLSLPRNSPLRQIPLRFPQLASVTRVRDTARSLR
jgi:hypothetical protein